MKTNINEMTHEEIIALTPEQLDWLVKYRCAENGVKNLPKPIQPDPFDPGFDKVVYEVAGFYFEGIGEAEHFCKTVNSLTTRVKLDYNWQVSSNYKYAQPISEDESFQVYQKKCYSRERYASLQGKLQDHEKAKADYKKQIEEFEKNEKEVACSRNEVMHVYEDHMRQEYTFKNHVANFKYYVALANGDLDIAEKFFTRAFTVSEEELVAIRLKVQE
jgi:tetratricopeptide (TPR) repeat protein